MALIAGPEGTESAEKIILQAPEYLKIRSPLIMEIGIGQTEALKKIIQGTGQYGPIEVLKDLAGIERVLMVHRKSHLTKKTRSSRRRTYSLNLFLCALVPLW